MSIYVFLSSAGPQAGQRGSEQRDLNHLTTEDPAFLLISAKPLAQDKALALAYEPPHVVQARERAGKSAKRTLEFGDLLVGNFASGKASAIKVTWPYLHFFVLFKLKCI